MATPLRTLPFPLLLDQAWATTRSCFRALFPPLAAALAPLALLLHVGTGWWNVQVVESGADAGLFCGAMAAFAIGFLVIGIGFFFVYGALRVAAAWAAAGYPAGVGASFRRFLRPSIWLTDLGAWLVILLGWAACLLPGLLVQVLWSLRMPVMVLEGRVGLAALSRSVELLFHHPERRLAGHPMVKMGLLMLLSLLLGWAVSMVVQMPAAVLNQVLLFREMAGGEAADPGAVVRASLWLSIPAGLAASFAQLAVQLYIEIAATTLMLDQRYRREGDDLAAELDRLSGRAGATA